MYYIDCQIYELPQGTRLNNSRYSVKTALLSDILKITDKDAQRIASTPTQSFKN